MLKRVLLDLYTKSGWARVLRSSVYADVEKNTKVIQAPCVTLFGESTPEAFFEGLDSSHISEGLIPRFLIVEHKGPRPPRNKHANMPPSVELVDRFAELVTIALTTANNGVCVAVQLDQDAAALMDTFDEAADDRINKVEHDIEMQVWNRAHLKALKLGALLAVSNNPHQPIVTADLAQWAIEYVKRDVQSITTRFHTGDVGHGDAKLAADLRRVVNAYLSTGDAAALAKAYAVPERMVTDKVIPLSYLLRRTSSLSAYRLDRRGATTALKVTLESFEGAGLLTPVGGPAIKSRYDWSGKAWCIGSGWK